MFWNLLWIVTALLSTGLSSLSNGIATRSPGATRRIDGARDSSGTASGATAGSLESFDSDRAPFSLFVGGEDVPFRVMAVYALPGEELPIQVTSADPGIQVMAGAADLRAVSPGRWMLRAPLVPATYPIRIGPPGGASVIVNLFVLVPYDRMRHGVLEGYRIGEYPNPDARGDCRFDRPRGFIRVTAADDSIQLSPHFQLWQFVCKECPSYPKFLVVQPTLLIKLERLLATARTHGVELGTFHVMSAYRTPLYNKGIGNPTTFSRHQYGDAADIFVDEHPRDGRMDDINHDGRVDRKDAALLRSWAETLDRDPTEGVLVGGLSDYGPTGSHGPFVHVDARGYSARW